MIYSSDVELFENLSQYYWNDIHYDFHNEYHCNSIIYEDGSFLLCLTSIIGEISVEIKFQNVEFEKIVFVNFSKLSDLTIDNLYRGRFEKEGQLFEFNDDKKSYFYLEFDEGPRMEFWSDCIEVKEFN